MINTYQSMSEMVDKHKEENHPGHTNSCVKNQQALVKLVNDKSLYKTVEHFHFLRELGLCDHDM